MNRRLVACPQCGRNAVWDTANHFRPFCSERCRLIDLGAWANEDYRVPVKQSDEDFDSVPESGGTPTDR